MNRKEWKHTAKGRIKKHYLLFLFLCLFLGMFGYEYQYSFSAVKSAISLKNKDIEIPDTQNILHRAFDALVDTNAKVQNKSNFVQEAFDALQHNDSQKELGAEKDQEPNEEQTILGVVSIGHSRGVLAQIAMYASSEALLTNLAQAASSIVHSQDGGIIIMIIASLIFSLFLSFFILNVINATIKRIFLEARIYDAIPLRRILFFQRIRRWIHAAKVMFLADIYQVLWYLTIVGGFIKRFSYMMVPYIIAENPNIRAKEAITLSRNMMNGHKWEALKLELSFLLWHILDALTFGLSGIFYSNAYREATLAEYYVYVRKLAIDNQIPEYESFNDTYLFERAATSELQNAYSDVYIQDTENEKENRMPVVKHFFRSVFGICLFYDQDEEIFEARMLQEEIQKDTINILNGRQYPGRLFCILEKEKVPQIEHINYLRHYSVCSIILIFFTMCMIGWLWEVSLHLITDGEFVNRGILHGPWLPIYGFGGVLILMFLYRFRKNAILQFVAAIILCGVLEYTTSWYLEIANDGMKWWNYSGYFINIHGRVCAEGLLVFGIGGVVIVYILAPLLDNLFRRIPLKIAAIICLCLVLAYSADQIYSVKHPNAGKGITNYASTEMNGGINI